MSVVRLACRDRGATNLVAFVDKLMGSRNQLQAVDMVELVGHLVAKQPSSATRADSPRIYVFWVRPHKVTKGTLVRNLLGASNHADLVDGSDLRAETSVDTEELAVDNSSQD